MVVNNEDLLLHLIFKAEDGTSLRPAEVQLLLSYVAELLKEIQETEEKDKE